MKQALFLLLILMGMFFLPERVHAIILLPAVILIPIAKLVALVVGGLALPVLSLGAVWAKVTHTSVHKIAIVLLGVLIFIGVCTVLFLKVVTPSRPVF